MDSRFPDFLKKQWVILADTVSSYIGNNDMTAASSLAFSATLALIPALFLLTSLLGIAIGSSHQAFSETQELVTEFIPRYSRAILDEVRFISAHKSAISALKTPAIPAPNSFEAASEPTASTPFISLRGAA